MTTKPIPFALLICAVLLPSMSAADDPRELVELPDRMQQHMLANMRDHLAAINEILTFLANDQTERAAEVAENRLGESAKGAHGAHHMGPLMPAGMRQIGGRMHRAASQFALVAETGSSADALQALSAVTEACVACHAGYRIR